MKFKILNIQEQNNKIHIEFETAFGKDRFRTDIKDKYIDKLTKKPQWLLNLRQHIDHKYNTKEKIPIPKSYTQYLNKEIDISEIPDTSPKNILTIHEQSIKDMQLAIEKENKQIKQLSNQHKDLISQKRQIETEIQNTLTEIEKIKLTKTKVKNICKVN